MEPTQRGCLAGQDGLQAATAEDSPDATVEALLDVMAAAGPLRVESCDFDREPSRTRRKSLKVSYHTLRVCTNNCQYKLLKMC